jgi:hypothetical protein
MRWCWDEADLRLIEKELSKLAAEDGGDWITLAEASREFRIRRWKLYALADAGILHIRHEVRPAQRLGSVYPQLRAVISRSLLARYLNRKGPAPGADARLISATEAVSLARGAFSLGNLSYWEDHVCPYLGRPLAVKRCDVAQSLRVPFHGEEKLVRRVRRNQKHYHREEIQEALRVFRDNLKLSKGCGDKKPSRAQGLFIDEEGARWLTQAAAFRLHRCRQQALEHWRLKGWLRAIRRRRSGYGQLREVWWYSEEDIRRLKKLQREGDGHVLFPKIGTDTAGDGHVEMAGGVVVETMPGASSMGVDKNTVGEVGCRRVERVEKYWEQIIETRKGVEEIRRSLPNIPERTAEAVCERLPQTAGNLGSRVSPPTLADRVQIDPVSSTATLDGDTFNGVNADGLRALDALRKAQLDGKTPISKRKLRQQYLPRCNHDTTLTRWFETLPERLLGLVKGQSGAGLRLVLPPHRERVELC